MLSYQEWLKRFHTSKIVPLFNVSSGTNFSNKEMAINLT